MSKLLMLTVWFVGFCALYLAPAHYTFFIPAQLPLLTIDEAVPLIPWTVGIYLSHLILIPVAYATISDQQIARRLFISMSLALIISALFFILMPTIMPPLTEAQIADLESPLFRFLYFFDRRTNCFPSLHVSLAILVTQSLGMQYKKLTPLLVGWALLIIISTLTTKQHYAIDLLGGMAVAYISFWLAARA